MTDAPSDEQPTQSDVDASLDVAELLRQKGRTQADVDAAETNFLDLLRNNLDELHRRVEDDE